MNYCLFRLRFKTEIHIGDDSGMTSLTACEEQIHSDTVFSSLCIEALQNGGYNKLNLLYSLIKDGSLLISDAFPFYNEELFLPKPFINIKSENINRSYENVKVLKKLKYIPSIKFEEYIGYMKGKNDHISNKVFDEQRTYIKSKLDNLDGLSEEEVQTIIRLIQNLWHEIRESAAFKTKAEKE